MAARPQVTNRLRAGGHLSLEHGSRRLAVHLGPAESRGQLVARALLVADVVALIAALVVANVAVGGPGALLLLGVLPFWVLGARAYGLYGRDARRLSHTTSDDVVRVFHLLTVGVWALVLGAWVVGAPKDELGEVALFWFLALLLIPIGRAAARRICRARRSYAQRTVIVGAGDVGQLVARKLERHPEYGLELVGFVDAEPKYAFARGVGAELLGSAEELPGVVDRLRIDRVIVAFSADRSEETVQIVRRLKPLGIQIDVVPRLFDVVGPNADLDSVEALPLVDVSPARFSREGAFAKRALDIVLASFMLLVTAPVMAFVAWRVRRSSPGPIFFRQTRLGMHMREFQALKFRTMSIGADAGEHRDFIAQTMQAAQGPNGVHADGGLFKLDRSNVVTPIGRWLRRTSLDELPQLFNVLRGDMSLVGPRPCIPYELEHFAPHHFDRFLVPAGLTGYWQVTARAHAPFSEALDMDVAYARGWSLALDLRLLWRTPLEILRSGRTA